MTVYVDDMRARYGRMIMCHMLADTEDELHAMAATIGVARRWYQGDHYDICLTKRAAAKLNGARDCSRRDAVGIRTAFRRYRAALPHRPPGTCYCNLPDHACYAAGHWVVRARLAQAIDDVHRHGNRVVDATVLQMSNRGCEGRARVAKNPREPNSKTGSTT